MATFVVCQIYIFPSSKHEIMTKMTKNENNDSFMRDKNIMRAVDGKRKSHFAWPKKKKLMPVFPFFRVMRNTPILAINSLLCNSVQSCSKS